MPAAVALGQHRPRGPDRALARHGVLSGENDPALANHDGRVLVEEQLADQRLDPAQRPPLVTGEPVRQRPFPQLQLQPCPLLRAQLLPRHRPPGPERFGSAVAPGLVPPPHRPGHNPQVVRDLINPVAAGEPLSRPQPQPLTPLLLGGRVPAPLRIPHALVIRPDGVAVTS